MHHDNSKLTMFSGFTSSTFALKHIWANLLKKLVSIPDREVLVASRCFDVRDSTTKSKIENIGRSFLTGYNLAIGTTCIAELKQELDKSPLSSRGFVYEGASMGLAVADFLTPFSQLWREYERTVASPYIYLVYVGYGWSLARLPIQTLPAISRLDKPIRWLAMDGYGFHQGYFHWTRYLREATPPGNFTGYAARAFDQGLGRSLWFVQGADPDRIAKALLRFSPERTPDLWAGVGLAATYAGGVSSDLLNNLRLQSGKHFPHLAQGAVFAAEARWRAGNPEENNELACRILCGMSLEEAAQIARDNYPADILDESGVEPYEIWRSRIRKKFGAIN